MKDTIKTMLARYLNYIRIYITTFSYLILVWNCKFEYILREKPLFRCVRVWSCLGSSLPSSSLGRSRCIHRTVCSVFSPAVISLLCSGAVGTGIAFLNPQNKSVAAMHTLTSQAPWRFMRRVTFAISPAALPSFKPFYNSNMLKFPANNSEA
jgi:hypothetical protein